jgi:hypothetical protein
MGACNLPLIWQADAKADVIDVTGRPWRRMQMQDRLLREGRLSPGERLVGIWILGRVNRVVHYAWPNSGTVARELGVSVRTVKNANAKLERLGYFQIQRNVGGGTNRYWPGGKFCTPIRC